MNISIIIIIINTIMGLLNYDMLIHILQNKAKQGHASLERRGPPNRCPPESPYDLGG